MSENIISLENPYIQSYTSNSLLIDNKNYFFPLVLTPQEIILDLLPAKFEEFYPERVTDIIAMTPELILIGTGITHHVLENRFSEVAIGVDMMATGAACRIFNVMIEENRNVVAALY